ncbi:MAG: hypothetical protein Q8O67_12880 [Deltaproteobacteria bacterium]|nr:hypothetical protein [Deltaproteobacteria bacterium]
MLFSPRFVVVVAAFVAPIVGAAACVPTEPVRAPVPFAVYRGERQAFLDAPWPSDLMVHADGLLNLRAFPNPFASQTLEDFLAIFATAPGYSRNTTMAFRVDGGVDEATLPADAAASVKDDSAMFVVELATLRRLPIEWKHYPEGTSYYPPGTVAVNLLLGAVPAGPFALVVTSDAVDRKGVPLGPAPDLRALLTCEPLEGAAVDVKDSDCNPYQQLRIDLKREAVDIAVVVKITPQESSKGLVDSVVAARAYVPVFGPIVPRAADERDPYTIYDGTITLAKFQKGRAPYDTYDGSSGGFVFGDDGLPIVQEEEVVSLVLTVPKETMPSTGWPVVVQSHGTGGDLESGLGRNPGAEAFHIAAAHAVMFAISEPLHLTRDGFREGQENVLTFNFFNPLAGRDNWRQSALEKVQQVSAIADLQFDDGGVTHRFDPNKIAYFGHSQGGIVGGLFVPVEDRIQGALLSGAGAGFAASMVEKVDPPPAIADILRLVLSMPDTEEIDTFHPVPAILQTFVDAADPLNYGDLWRHRSGRTTPHLVATSGLVDTFTPKRNHAGLAGSFGLPVADPVSEPLAVTEILGIGTADDVVTGNLTTDDGDPLTAVMIQFPTDGHFAIFNNPVGQQIFTDFFQTLFQDGVPTVRSR